MQEQLFDLQKDPWEIIDVINNTQHQLMLIQMRERLRELREFVK
jgi:hypothetical protein